MIRLHQGSSVGEMGLLLQVAAHQTSAAQCPLWVNSDLFGPTGQCRLSLQKRLQ